MSLIALRSLILAEEDKTGESKPAAASMASNTAMSLRRDDPSKPREGSTSESNRGLDLVL